MKIPILSGIYTTNAPDLGIAYPVNMVPVVLPSGVNEGYLRPGDGIEGVDNPSIEGSNRGAIAWDGVCYRVVGNKFVKQNQDGSIDEIGDIPGFGMVSMDYSYPTVINGVTTGLLAIVADKRLFYYSNVTNTITEVTDPDLGEPIDVVWSNGYFVLTDGTYVYNTDLNNPYAIATGNYTTTDVDPDPIVGLVKFQNEVYVLNKNTIQVLVNTGQPVVGTFTFSTVDGGQITKGCVGTHAACVFDNSIAFMGGSRNEAPGIYIGANASTQKISTVEIDRELARLSDDDLADILIEARNDNAHKHLYVHLPDRTYLFDSEASRAFGVPVWSVLTSSDSMGPYFAASMVWAYSQWNVGDPTSSRTGYFTTALSSHWGVPVRWELSTPIVYNDSAGGLFHELELVALTGTNIPLGPEPTISTSYSDDGQNWSPSKSILAGVEGQTTKRLVWFKQGRMENMRIQRFQGNSNAHIPVIRLQARVEPLEY